MSPDERHTGPRGWRRTVFWKLAALLIGVQVLVGVLAVGLTAYFAYEAGLDLVENSLRLRLDGLAEELERRVPDLPEGALALAPPVVNDLSTRFPDPILLVDSDGRPLRTIHPDPRVFGPGIGPPDETVPRNLAADLASGDVVIRHAREVDGRAYAAAPLFDAAGFLAAGVVVFPLERSIDRELEETVGALRRAAAAVSLVAVLLAVVVGGLLTWAIVRPIRSITASVERIGGGDYRARLDEQRGDEFGRLARTVNTMAGKVDESFSALVATDRLRRDLVANIGHDLRTPLGGLLGHLEEAQRRLEASDPDGSLDALTSARRQVAFVTRLVEDLFELSLLDSERPPLRLEPVPFGELVQQAVDAQKGMIDAGTSLTVKIEPGLPVLFADGTRLLRLIQNLLDNARKHTPAGGRVTVAASRQGADVKLTVEDTGPGIEPEDIENLFDRYYRGNAPRTRRGSGTGLGLAISLAVAEAHGGSLSVDSRPGEGSTFTLLLPVGERAGKNKSPAGPPAGPLT